MVSLTTRDLRRDWKWYLLAIFLSLNAFKVLMSIHAANMDALSASSYGVVIGKPHWLAYQNRLLGPYTVLLISKFGLPFKKALIAYIGVFLVAQSCLILFLLRTMRLSIPESISALTLFIFAFLALQHNCFYAWDSIDLIVFTLFAFGILKGMPVAFYIPLFIIGLANRESALFIALFLAIDAFRIDPRRWTFRLANRPKLLLAVLMMTAGAVYTKLIRHALFISSPNGKPDTANEMLGNHIYITQNLKDIFFHNLANKNIIYSFTVLFCLYHFTRHSRSLSGRQFKCYLVLLALIANISIFGIFNETRMLFIAIPFVFFLSIDMAMGKQRQHADEVMPLEEVHHDQTARHSASPVRRRSGGRAS